MKKKLKLKSLHFAVGALVIGAFLPIFIKNDYYMMVLNRVLINIIVVLGLNFITGLTGQMNLAQRESLRWALIPLPCLPDTRI